MKNYIYIITLIMASSFISCEKDFLDVVPDNTPVIDNAFTNTTSAKGFLYTIYQALPNPSNLSGEADLTAGGEVWYTIRSGSRSGFGITLGDQNINGPIINKWTGGSSNSLLYVGIRNANIFLEKLPSVEDLSAQDLTSWSAEAKFLKAYYHFNLIRMYGPIVLNDVNVPVSSSVSDLKITRSTIDECFTYVLNLMDEAITELPDFSPDGNNDFGRVTKPIAMAIKARVAMTYASPMFNGNVLYNEFVNENGEHFFPQQVSPEKWAIATVAVKEAIDKCEEVGHRLWETSDFIPERSANDDLSDFTKLKSALRGRVTEPWNHEIIWGHPSNTTGTLQSWSTPRLEAYTAANPMSPIHSVPLHVVDMYYSENGVPIVEDINYDYSNRYDLKTAGNNELYTIQTSTQTAGVNFNREPRFYADLGFDKGVWYGNGKTNDLSPWYIKNKTSESGGITIPTSSNITGYFPKKLVNLGSQVVNGNSYSRIRYAFPIIRMSDLYLYYAEALNETKGTPDNEVYQYVDIIRERAGLVGVVESWENFSNNPSKPLSQLGMRTIIQNERLIEFAFEGARVWDSRRWLKTKTLMSGPVYGWDVFSDEESGYYTRTLLGIMNFSERDYLWPISQNELSKNTKLIQNPGW